MPRQPRDPACIFCRKTDSEPSKEDVIPKWIARMVGSKRKKTLFTAKTGTFVVDSLGISETPSAMEFGAVGKFGWTTQGPCKRCNNTWMSRLETAVKPTLAQLIHAETCLIRTDQLLALARWSLKTTLLWEYMHYESDRYFKPLDRKELFQALMIPSHTYMFVARYYGSLTTMSLGGPSRFDFTHADLPAGSQVYTATHAIGQVAVQVFSFRNPKNLRLQIRSPGGWDHVSKRFWPIKGNLSWPPDAALDDDGLKAFATRWRGAAVIELRL